MSQVAENLHDVNQDQTQTEINFDKIFVALATHLAQSEKLSWDYIDKLIYAICLDICAGKGRATKRYAKLLILLKSKNQNAFARDIETYFSSYFCNVGIAALPEKEIFTYDKITECYAINHTKKVIANLCATSKNLWDEVTFSKHIAFCKENKIRKTALHKTYSDKEKFNVISNMASKLNEFGLFEMADALIKLASDKFPTYAEGMELKSFKKKITR